ncbi:MAG TPA: CocE/NonD family hydrolase [Bryobacteraceae bacterium]|nr:CocE/NonD family hydrolase [Bryobacteraceae bacterium]
MPSIRAVRIFLAGIALPAALLGTAAGPAHWVARVRMRDGIHLDTSIFLPSSNGRFPTVLVRTPYGKGSSLLPGYRVLLEHDYAIVVQDVRGRHGSEGVFNAFAREGPDGSDTIDWIARQPWSDGGVAMSGGSYLGFAQWEAALQGNPHLKAIFPAVSGSDPYRDRFYSPGGALKLGHRLAWFAENLSAPGFHASFGSYTRHLPLRTADRAATGRTLEVFQKVLSHPAYDSFWKKMGILNRLDKVHAAVFAMGGWYDNYVEGDLAAFSELSRLDRHPRLVIGPWPHNMSVKFRDVDFGPHSGAPIRRYQWQWLDHVLKSPPSTVPQEFSGPLRIFVIGANRWRDEQEWPLARARSESLYLGARGVLDREPAREEPPDRYLYDPQNPVPTRGGAVCCDPSLFPWGPMDQRPVEKRGDVLVYTGPVLKREMEVTGPIRVVLYISTTARDTDFTAKLVDVFPDGEARNLTDGILRLRYRNGLDRAVMAKPGEVYAITIDAGVTSNVFLAGHRIRLEISSSNFPRFDRNPNTGTSIADETGWRTALQSIYHDRKRPSALILPVVPELTSFASTRYGSKRKLHSPTHDKGAVAKW